MENLRLEIVRVPNKDLLNLNGDQVLIQNTNWKFGEVQVPNSRDFCKGQSHSPYFNAYRFEINNLPIPLGFIHNQYEPYLLLISYGDFRAQLILLIQWLLILIMYLRFFTNRNFNKKTRKNILLS